MERRLNALEQMVKLLSPKEVERVGRALTTLTKALGDVELRLRRVSEADVAKRIERVEKVLKKIVRAEPPTTPQAHP